MDWKVDASNSEWETRCEQLLQEATSYNEELKTRNSEWETLCDQLQREATSLQVKLDASNRQFQSLRERRDRREEEFNDILEKHLAQGLEDQKKMLQKEWHDKLKKEAMEKLKKEALAEAIQQASLQVSNVLQDSKAQIEKEAVEKYKKEQERMSKEKGTAERPPSTKSSYLSAHSPKRTPKEPTNTYSEVFWRHKRHGRGHSH